MKSVGIICECNPFHGGHQYLIDRARASGADAVICVMSGNFVQRGEPAVLSPYARAEILASSGADAVFELPFPFSAASAEFFGRAGVEMLSRLGVDELWFGSESGDLTSLSHLATLADSPAFIEEYAKRSEGESGTASTYFALLSERSGLDTPCAPNDILALSYLRALRRLNSSMRPVTVQRQGSGYSEQKLTEGQFPSATALRRTWRTQGLTALDEYLSPLTASVAAREQNAGNAPALLEYATPLVLGMLRLTPLEELEQYAGLSGGLAGRIKDAAIKSTTLDNFYTLCATKKYPDARIRRGVLSALLRVRDEDLRAPIAYARLLAANDRGCEFLAQVRRVSTLPVVTRKTDLPDATEAQRQFDFECRAAALYSLCLPKTAKAEEQMRLTPLIFSNKREKK